MATIFALLIITCLFLGLALAASQLERISGILGDKSLVGGILIIWVLTILTFTAIGLYSGNISVLFQ